MAEIRLSIDLPVTPERIFAYLTSGRLISEWLASGADVHPLADGSIAIDTADRHIDVRYLEVVAPRRVVMAWSITFFAAASPIASRLEFTVRPVGELSRVEVIHWNLPDGAVEALRLDWAARLERVRRLLEREG